MNNEHHHEKGEFTRRLYFEDAYRTEFGAIILERLTYEGRPAVVLDQTCFYPESGGQPADRGSLQGVPVADVQEIDGKILHLLNAEIAPDRVEGSVDWSRRFDHMQQHSGQHILSQSFVEVLGGETRSFHLGQEASTVEIGIGSVTEEEAGRVEKRANDILFQDREIKTYFVEEALIGSVPLRKPSQKQGSIRVVEMEAFDYSACGGTHCRRTGEVGLIKITRWDKIRDNVRFEFLCGGRALRDYALKTTVLRSLCRQLTASQEGLPASVEKLSQESKSANKDIRRLREIQARYEALEIIEKNPGRLICGLLTAKTAEEMKLLALNIIRTKECAVAFTLHGPEHDRLLCGRSDGLDVNLRDLVPIIFSQAKGKGGGSPSLIELVLEKGSDLEAVLAKSSEFLKNKLLD